MKPTILIVEDDVSTRKLLTLHLRRNSFQVFTAQDAEEGFGHIKKRQIDLLLLDIKLPQMSGIELCKQIRLQEAYHHIPIIFLSGKKDTEFIIEGLNAGGDDYITKPYNVEELIARLHAALRWESSGHRSPTTEDHLDKLTFQEKRILKLISEGRTNKEIAQSLILTEGSVKVYNHRIFHKLCVKNRIQAVAKARKMKII